MSDCGCGVCGRCRNDHGGWAHEWRPSESREERIEAYYDESARQLAEWLVDLEDELAELKARLEGLEK